jgi:hypothetical protein
LVDPIIIKQGYLAVDPTDTEMKDLFLLLSNLNDHSKANIELMANELLQSSLKAQVKSFDALFTQADADNNQNIELSEWANLINSVEGSNFFKNNAEIEKHWKNTK